MKSSTQPASQICSICHASILPSYYFCPNCGNKVNTPPLSTSITTQIGIYAFSIILPMIGFILVTKWPGVQYFKSKDEKTKKIGIIAWSLLILSTLITIWLAYIWTLDTIQSVSQSINTDMGF